MQPPDLLTNSGYRDCRVKVLELVFSGMRLHSLIFKTSLFAKVLVEETTKPLGHGAMGRRVVSGLDTCQVCTEAVHSNNVTVA